MNNSISFYSLPTKTPLPIEPLLAFFAKFIFLKGDRGLCSVVFSWKNGKVNSKVSLKPSSDPK
jgi:hypothetical protein